MIFIMTSSPGLIWTLAKRLWTLISHQSLFISLACTVGFGNIVTLSGPSDRNTTFNIHTNFRLDVTLSTITYTLYYTVDTQPTEADIPYGVDSQYESLCPTPTGSSRWPVDAYGCVFVFCARVWVFRLFVSIAFVGTLV